MALSDWASIIFDNDGKCTLNNGEFGRIFIEPYKCWIYIQSPEIWKDGESFVNCTIAQMDEGSLNILGVRITIESVDLVNKDGIPYGLVRLFYCEQGYGESAKRYGGIVCSAHLDIESKIAKELGIPDHCEIGGGSSSNDKGEWMDILWGYDPTNVYNNGKAFEFPLPEKWQKFDRYCGITQDMINAFIKWNIPDKTWIEKVKMNDNLQWTNQGDAFFVGSESQQTIGQRSEPMIVGMINKI